MTPRALVIGYGSIGARHARILEALAFNVSVASRRGEAGGRRVFRSVSEAMTSGAFDHVVVADETVRHFATLTELASAGHRGAVLVEKPLFVAPGPVPPHGFRAAAVGYNLRFHPVVAALRETLGNRRAEIASLHVGQWLGDWRPGREATTTYSASQARGGGVLRDLSHELDLATWLFGPWMRVAALGGRLGTVTIDADDGWGILMVCKRCPVVTLHLDALDRVGRRTIVVQVDGETLRADLVAATLEIGSDIRRFSVARDATYATMHRAMLHGSADLCTFDEGLRVVDLVDAVERA